jgi:hypothetical protein
VQPALGCYVQFTGGLAGDRRCHKMCRRARRGKHSAATGASCIGPLHYVAMCLVSAESAAAVACVCRRMMGAARSDERYSGSTQEVFTRLAEKAGYQVIVPQVGRTCWTAALVQHDDHMCLQLQCIRTAQISQSGSIKWGTVLA